jgi:hypothetical protein
MRNEWWGFFAAGDFALGAARNLLSGLPDRFSFGILH